MHAVTEGVYATCKATPLLLLATPSPIAARCTGLQCSAATTARCSCLRIRLRYPSACFEFFKALLKVVRKLGLSRSLRSILGQFLSKNLGVSFDIFPQHKSQL